MTALKASGFHEKVRAAVGVPKNWGDGPVLAFGAGSDPSVGCAKDQHSTRSTRKSGDEASGPFMYVCEWPVSYKL